MHIRAKIACKSAMLLLVYECWKQPAEIVWKHGWEETTECVPHRVNHYLSLVVAENPLEAHREYKRRTQVRGFAAPSHVRTS